MTIYTNRPRAVTLFPPVPQTICRSILEFSGAEHANLRLYVNDELGNSMWCVLLGSNLHWSELNAECNEMYEVCTTSFGQEDETAIEFAQRVKADICRKGCVMILDWAADGRKFF